jgi:hypothetical protein
MKWFAHVQHHLIMHTIPCLLVIRLRANGEDCIAKLSFRNHLALTSLVMIRPLYMIGGFFPRWNTLH